jgi:hypothetical protein
MPVGGQEPGPAAYQFRTFLAGRFHRTFQDCELTAAVSSQVKPVETFLQNIERCIRSMDLKAFLLLQVADPEINVAAEEMNPDPVVSLSGQIGEFHLRVIVKAEIVFLSKIDFSSPVICPQLISLNEGQIDHALL